MSSQDLIVAEYNSIRSEIVARVKLLHLFLLVAILFNLTFLLMAFTMFIVGVSGKQIIDLLLFVPIIFALLTFNYQANQMTFEGAAGFLNSDLRKKLPAQIQKDFDAWDIFYGARKKKYQLTSFLKVLPLLLPMTIPLWLYLYDFSIMAYPTNLLFWFDMILFGLVIFNFRYKL